MTAKRCQEVFTTQVEKVKFSCKIVAMKEKDPIANAFKKMGEFKLSDESTQALASYLRGRILRDREIEKKFFPEKKK